MGLLPSIDDDNQNLILFTLGKAMLDALNIKGTNEFTNPPIETIIAVKETMINVWALIIKL